jgi:hypothetical protein
VSSNGSEGGYSEAGFVGALVSKVGDVGSIRSLKWTKVHTSYGGKFRYLY